MQNTPEDPKEIQLEHHVNKKQIYWSMPSANGRSQFRCAPIGRSEKSAALICQLDIFGEFWPRGRINSGTKTTEDFHVVISQVLIDFKSIQSLRERLVEWHANPSEFMIVLTSQDEGDQQFKLSIGSDSKLLFSVWKPACVLTYECGSSMQGRWSFLIDQSCIRLCAEELGDFIRQVKEHWLGE
jgi:hypothetical protein